MIRVTEPFAAPPRITPPRRCSLVEPDDLELDRGLLELSGVDLRSATLAVEGVDELLIEDSIVSGVDLTAMTASTLDIVRSTLDRCDLSRMPIRSIRGSRIAGTKLVGSELSGAMLTDVHFERCTFRYANLRMANLRRVRFEECQLVDVDAFEASMEDVEFEGSVIAELNIDRLSATRVDLRHASTLELRGIGNLQGMLVAEEQLPGLAHLLAAAVGLDIEALLEP